MQALKQVVIDWIIVWVEMLVITVSVHVIVYSYCINGYICIDRFVIM